MTADVSHIFENARVAARKLNLVDTETIDKILLAVADEAEKEVDYILQENCRDLALMPKIDPKYDRLMLSRERILGITSDMRKVAGLLSIGQNIGFIRQAQRHAHRKKYLYRSSHRHYLRSPSQCNLRRFFSLLEIGECLYFEGR